MSAARRALTGLGIVVALALLAVLALWAFQRKLIYLPFGAPGSPQGAGLVEAETVRLSTEDGLELGAWFVPAARPASGTTVVIFNGNGGNRSFRGPLARALARRGIAALLFDYRGYGDSPGHPTEAGLAADARAAVRYLEGRPGVDRGRIVYFGESLGAAVAVELALQRPPAALVLRSPFTSLAETAGVHYPFLPVGLLLRDRFPSLDRMRALRVPLLVVAGEADRIIPAEQSRRIHDAAPGPKRLLLLPGADHNDAELLAGPAMLAALEEFLREHGLL